MDINKKNSIWLAGQYMVAILFSFITLKVNLMHFGERIFGIWITMIALWGLGSVVDFGLGISIIKFIAEEKRKNLNVNSLIATGFYSFLALGIIIFAVVFIIAEIAYFPNESIVLPEMHNSIFMMFLFLGLSFYAKYIAVFLKAIFEGFNDYIVTSKINIINTLLIFTSVIITSLLNFSIVELALLYFLSSSIVVLLLIYQIKKKIPDLNFSFKKFEGNRLKKILSFSFTVQGSTMLGKLMDPAVKYIIGSFFSLDYVSIFEIARRFAVAITGLFHTSFRNLLPRSSGLISLEEKQKFALKDLADTSKLAVTYSGLMFGVLIWFPPLLMEFWFNSRAAILVYLMLALPESINAYGYPIYVFFLGIGKAFLTVYVQFINLAGYSIILFSAFYFFDSELGFLGYFVTVVVGNIFLFYIFKNYMSLNLGSFLQKSGFSRLAMLNALILLSVFFLYANSEFLWFVLGGISFISMIMFYGELNNFFKLIKNLKQKYYYK